MPMGKEISPLVWNEKVPTTKLEKFRNNISEKYNTELEKFRNNISKKYNIKLDSYWDLHQWSVKNFPDFWKEAWDYVGIITSEPYKEVFQKTGPGFLDHKWLPGCRFNYAENILRVRDDTKALVCIAESDGKEEVVTFAELFEEVKLYAAAFRNNGLKKGDTVACFMPNRKEALIVFLATASIGAIFGGPPPYFGAKAAAFMISKLNPKFLISVDGFIETGITYNNADHVPFIVENTPSVQKVIIVPTKAETTKETLPKLPDCYLLPDFLKTGRNADGVVPDLHFEQLPFDHPLAINYTSGTTGNPKGLVHCAGVLLTNAIFFKLYYNLKKGEAIHSNFRIGWVSWYLAPTTLSMGMTLVLEQGCTGCLWDVLARYRVRHTILITSVADRLEKNGEVPSPTSNMEHLDFIVIGGAPVTSRNHKYILNKVKKDVFINTAYGSTEVFGFITACDVNLPNHASETQIPCLGVDIQCFDSEGNSVVDEIGESVLCTPFPSLPIRLWGEEGEKTIQKIYLDKYPGVWWQSDTILKNSKTKGFVIIGRSDDALIQNGDRFSPTDIYNSIADMEEIWDSLCVNQNSRRDGECRAVLFLQLRDGGTLTPALQEKVRARIQSRQWVNRVPRLILQARQIPYNFNHKKMESLVRKIIATNSIPEVQNVRNPECLPDFLNIPEILEYDRE